MTHPSKLGKYEIRRELGKGAMGVVYEAFDPSIERVVALKTIRADQLGGEDAPEILARFRREAQAAGRLKHPNIVAIYELRRGRRHDLHRDGVRRGPRAQGVLRASDARSRAPTARAHHERRSSTRSTTRTGTASSTATSSRRTS